MLGCRAINVYEASLALPGALMHSFDELDSPQSLHGSIHPAELHATLTAYSCTLQSCLVCSALNCTYLQRSRCWIARTVGY